MSPVAELLAALGAVLETLGFRWYLFGAQAAIVHGAARLTADVDVTVALPADSIPTLVDALAEAGFASRTDDVLAFAERTRVVPVAHDATGIPVDLVLAGPGLEERFLERAVHVPIESVSIPVACAEDLLAMKILAGRPKDLEDAVAIAAAREGKLDLALIGETLGALESMLDRSDLRPALDEVLRRAKR